MGASRHEHPNPLCEDGDLEEREYKGIADSEYKDVLSHCQFGVFSL